jgi:predicted deacetylase
LSKEEHETSHTGRSLVVSVHDVAPSTLDEVRWLLAQLDGLGVRPRVLKVVPNENGSGDLRGCPALVDLLQREAAQGAEIVLHGYTHRAVGPYRGPWAERLRARLFAGDAAEFLSLNPPMMAARLDAGRRILAESGLRTDAFCAPAWLAPPELPELLRGLGFHHLIGMATVSDLGSRRRLRMPWLGYMGAGAFQERLLGVIGAGTRCAGPILPVIKIFLHPQAAPTSAACARVLRTLAGLLHERRPVTYAQLLSI